MSFMLLVTGCGSKKTYDTSLMEYNEFKDIVIAEVSSLEIIEYTIGGEEKSTIDNYDDIVKKYNYLNNFKIGDETSLTCEDKTTIYNFIQNEKIITIYIECGNVLVINDKRFDLIK